MENEEIDIRCKNSLPATEWELKNLTFIIYKYINVLNGKILIGQAWTTFRKRYGQDRYTWWKRASNAHFQKALKKFNGENFIIQIIDCDKSEEALDKLERYYILKYQSDDPSFGYNKTTGGRATITRPRIKQVEFIDRSKHLHNNKYDYSSVIYDGWDNKVDIFCLSCKKFFQQSAGKHLAGRGCPKCSKRRGIALRRMTFEEFLRKASLLHESKYQYDSYNFVNAQSKINIFHIECGNNFSQRAGSHLNGSGCPDCAKNSRISLRSVAVAQINTKTGREIARFSSVSNAERYVLKTYGVNSKHISEACNNAEKTVAGFNWKYV